MGSISSEAAIRLIKVRTVVDGMSSSRNSISLKVGVGNRRVELTSGVDLSHVGSEGSDLAVGCTVGSIIVTGNDKDGLGETRSIKGDCSGDRVYHQLHPEPDGFVGTYSVDRECIHPCSW